MQKTDKIFNSQGTVHTYLTNWEKALHYLTYLSDFKVPYLYKFFYPKHLFLTFL